MDINEKFTNSLGEETQPPYDAKCSMCGREGNREDLAIKGDGFMQNGLTLCWDCYMGKNLDNKKGLWKCRIGLHKWHPMLTNPKVCYRCGYEWNNTLFRRGGVSMIPFKPNWRKIDEEETAS